MIFFLKERHWYYHIFGQTQALNSSPAAVAYNFVGFGGFILSILSCQSAADTVANRLLENIQQIKTLVNYHHSSGFQFHSFTAGGSAVCFHCPFKLFFSFPPPHLNVIWNCLCLLFSSCTYGQNRHISLDYSITPYCNSITAKREFER